MLDHHFIKFHQAFAQKIAWKQIGNKICDIITIICHNFMYFVAARTSPLKRWLDLKGKKKIVIIKEIIKISNHQASMTTITEKILLTIRQRGEKAEKLNKNTQKSAVFSICFDCSSVKNLFSYSLLHNLHEIYVVIHLYFDTLFIV